MKHAQEMVDLVTQVRQSSTKLIVITGGVCSSIGKGVLLSGIGTLLKGAGYSVGVMKCDPYLNVDPGTMSPLVHGEVFVTSDGAETDLDLGHYERLIGVQTNQDSSLSAGQVFAHVLEGERTGAFLGKCIQLVPHVVDVVKRRILEFMRVHAPEFVLVEIGGTVGDMEGDIFLEAIRQLRFDLGSEKIMHAHLSFVPTLSWNKEIKTKPTQHGMMLLKHAGLVPDCLFLRSDTLIDDGAMKKVAVMCGIAPDMVFQVLTYDLVYRLFLDLDAQRLGTKVAHYFKIEPRASDLRPWQMLIERICSSTKSVRIGMVIKYLKGADPYISVIEALRAAAHNAGFVLDLLLIDSSALEQEGYAGSNDAWQQLRSADGIVVPGGFDSRGVAGKILACRWAREHDIPYFGLCLGMQVMLIEIARSLLGLPHADSTEFTVNTPDPVIDIMAEQKKVIKKGASMRLGSYPCTIMPGTKAWQAYGKQLVLERHRHRYEVNNAYRTRFESVGVTFSGMYQERDLVEISEFSACNFMLGVQFHPEFQCSPLEVHPLFAAFVQAVSKKPRPRIDQLCF